MNQINTHHNQPVDRQLGTLLAFIILFQKKIQQLRIKLAGNEEFHSRLAFQFIDEERKNIITAQKLAYALNRYGHQYRTQQTQLFCSKQTVTGAFSYDQFIKFITPKTNKVLAQRLMIRTCKANSELPLYVLKIYLELISTSIKMILVTENIKKQIQQNDLLTHVELLEFFRKCCCNKANTYYFINTSTQGNQQYDFSLQQVKYLSHHTKKNTQIENLMDHQIKEIICPLDMNVHKILMTTFTQPRNKTNYFKTQKNLKTQQNENVLKANQTSVNFLQTNYKQTWKNFNKPQRYIEQSPSERQGFDTADQNITSLQPIPTVIRNVRPQRDNSYHYNQKQNDRVSFQQGSVNQTLLSNYQNLYIQQFAKESKLKGSGNRNSILKGNNNYGYQKFQDDFYNNRSDLSSASKGSAFVQY